LKDLRISIVFKAFLVHELEIIFSQKLEKQTGSERIRKLNQHQFRTSSFLVEKGKNGLKITNQTNPDKWKPT